MSRDASGSSGPSFLMAGVLEMLVFAVVDPATCSWFGGAPVDLSRHGGLHAGLPGLLGGDRDLRRPVSAGCWTAGATELHRRPARQLTGPGAVGRAGSSARLSRARRSPALQACCVEHADLALLDLQQAVVLELREGAAHRLQLQAEVAADLLARHAQDQRRLARSRARAAAASGSAGRPPGALRRACCPAAASRRGRARSRGS